MSRLVNLIPVILLFIFVGVAGFIGYQIYLYTQDLAHKGHDSMAKRNITLSSDGGMKVGVKHMSEEEYASKTQKKVVEAWNLSSWPEYKSRIWNQDAEVNKRPSYGWSRHSSEQASGRNSPSNGGRPGMGNERGSSWFSRHHSHGQ